MKQLMFGDSRGGGGASQYRLTRRERVLLVGVGALNAGMALVNFSLWCAYGPLLSLASGYLSTSMVLWMIQKNRKWW